MSHIILIIIHIIINNLSSLDTMAAKLDIRVASSVKKGSQLLNGIRTRLMRSPINKNQEICELGWRLGGVGLRCSEI